MRIKRRIQRLSIWLTYHFSCLHSHEHSIKRFRREYHLHEEIGRGGFGVVYRGFRVSDGIPVAVKFVAHKYVREWVRYSDCNEVHCDREKKKCALKPTSSHDCLLKNKTTECRKHGQLVPMEMQYLQECADLDGVVNLIDWFANRKGFLMVMECPNNCMDLFDVISVYGRLDEEIARQIFEQVVNNVVELVQKHSIVHRDIKDENIIVNMETGVVQLVDFGAADYLEVAKFKDFQGTKSYCPPEWFKRNCYLPLESTVWSLGVLLYIMLTGNNPFKSEIQICVGRPKFPDYVSADSQDLIKQCLNPSPERRLQLENILKHKFFHPNITKNAKDINEDSGHGSVSSSFRRRTLGNSRRPFHALLHRRSMRRRRLRDCDNGLKLLDDLDSNSDTECSYRQSMHLNLDIPNSPFPITIPKHITNVATKKVLDQQELFEKLDYLNNCKKYTEEPISKMQESSSGFETAAEELEEQHPLNSSKYRSLTDSFPFFEDNRNKFRKNQLIKMQQQHSFDTGTQNISVFSQSSYKSALSNQNIMDSSIILSNLSDVFASTEEKFLTDTLNNFKKKVKETQLEDMIVEQSSTNMYFSAKEDGLRSGAVLQSQSSTDFWSASDVDGNNHFENVELANELSNTINDNDITINIDEDNASVNDVHDEFVYENEHTGLLAVCMGGSKRSSTTPTYFEEATPSFSAAPSRMTLLSSNTTDFQEAMKIQHSEIACHDHMTKSSTLSPQMCRRPPRRLSRRMRDAVHSSKIDTSSSSSESECSITRNYLKMITDRRELSVPCKIEKMLAIKPSALLSAEENDNFSRTIAIQSPLNINWLKQEDNNEVEIKKRSGNRYRRGAQRNSIKLKKQFLELEKFETNKKFSY